MDAVVLAFAYHLVINSLRKSLDAFFLGFSLQPIDVGLLVFLFVHDVFVIKVESSKLRKIMER
jgi:hypothetical protein